MYADRRPESITEGFPTPPTLSQTTPEEQEVLASLPDAPEKRTPLPVNLPPTPEGVSRESTEASTSTKPGSDAEFFNAVRPPRNVAAAYLKPLRRQAEYGVPTADLQLRSYSVRNVEFMADFAMRAAFYLGLPASGPTPLPKIIERWTVPRSNFVHKKSQENFERITLRRLVQIQDGHVDTVQVWLAYLRKHAFYGVGMKADVWNYEGLDVGANMDNGFVEVEKELDEKLSMFGWNKTVAGERSVKDAMRKQGVKHTGVPMMEVREASQTREQRI